MSDKRPRTSTAYVVVLATGACLSVSGIVLLVIFSSLPPTWTIALATMISLGILMVVISVIRLSLPVVVMIRTKEELLAMLTDSEREILEILARSGGHLSQTDIAKATGFSPSKVSRLLRRLEELGVIIRRRENKRKIVYLKPEFWNLLKSKRTQTLERKA